MVNFWGGGERKGGVCARRGVCARVCVYCVHVFLTGSHCVALTQESLRRPGWPPTYKIHLPLSLETRIKSVHRHTWHCWVFLIQSLIKSMTNKANL